MEALAGRTRSDRVEVSGWDATDNFFVEKTTIERTHEAEIAISLCSTLRPGCMLFVRLLSSLSRESGCPIAYLAAHVEQSQSTGRVHADLIPFRPRTS